MGSTFQEAPRVLISAASNSNLPHGEGSPLSENLEHSDSTEELLQSQTTSTETSSFNQKSIPNKQVSSQQTNNKQPPPKASSNQTSVVNNRKTDALAVTGGTSRVKRNSERSIASGTSRGSKKDDQCSTSEVSAEVSKLEDELKR